MNMTAYEQVEIFREYERRIAHEEEKRRAVEQRTEGFASQARHEESLADRLAAALREAGPHERDTTAGIVLAEHARLRNPPRRYSVEVPIGGGYKILDADGNEVAEWMSLTPRSVRR